MYKENSFFFIGIGGIGMSGIAECLKALGYNVSGSDIKMSYTTKHLEELGINVFYEHNPANIKDNDIVIYSSAIKEDNPEFVWAKKNKLITIARAQMLGELIRSKYSIAVAGSHGKSTTSSLLTHILDEAKFFPSYILGSRLKKNNKNAHIDKGKFIVVEADESDASFLRYKPTISIITNIDADHLDFYKNMDNIKSAFLNFAQNTYFYGATIVCIDDENTKNLLPKIKNKKIFTYSTKDKSADIYADNICFEGNFSIFDISFKGKTHKKIKLNLSGIHNIENSLAAILAAIEIGIDINTIKEALTNFAGLKRRLDIKGEKNKILVVDDYAHHPAEIKATLLAAKSVWKNSRIIALFQPHRFSRTKALMEDFSKSFKCADTVLLLPVYAAGEEKIKNINSQILCSKIKDASNKNAFYFEDKNECLNYLNKELKEKDVLITMGAGDVYKFGDEFLKKTKK